MFNQLFKLYKQHHLQKPLEDFTTEAFVGILNIEENIKTAFIQDFLKLPESNYNLRTQVYYELENDQNCIIDFVLEGEHSICFVENKINSSEGYRQIERYSKVLDGFRDADFETYLFYCTKYSDTKKNRDHNFRQIKWFEIMKFLKKYNNNIIDNFLEFLLTQDIAQEFTMKAQDFITFGNLKKSINLINSHLNRVKPIFKKTFKATKISDGTSTSQIIKHNRMIYFFPNIIGHGAWSELKYGFLFNKPCIYVSIYIDKKNIEYKKLINEAKERGNFSIIDYDKGSAINLQKDISVFLNDEEVDVKISNWYKNSFSIYIDFMKTTNHLKWNIDLFEKQ